MIGNIDVPPGLSVENRADCGARYAQSLGELIRGQAGTTQGEDLPDLLVAELGLVALHANTTRRWRIAMLPAHVSQVVLLCTDKEVFGVDANRVVTAVQNTLRGSQ